MDRAERERRKLEEFAKLPPVFHYEADGVEMIGTKSVCPRCEGPLILSLTAEKAAELERSDEITAENLALVVMKGMATEEIVCGRCRRAQTELIRTRRPVSGFTPTS